MFNVLNGADGRGLNGQGVAETGAVGCVSSHFKSVLNSVGQSRGRVPIGVVFKVGEIRIQEDPNAAHDGDDHGEQHDHAEHFADGSFIVAATTRSKRSGSSVHDVDTTPYHLAIDLKQPQSLHLAVCFSAEATSVSAPM